MWSGLDAQFCFGPSGLSKKSGANNLGLHPRLSHSGLSALGDLRLLCGRRLGFHGAREPHSRLMFWLIFAGGVALGFGMKSWVLARPETKGEEPKRYRRSISRRFPIDCGRSQVARVDSQIPRSALRIPHFKRPAWLSSDSSGFVNRRAIRPTGVQVSPSAPAFARRAARARQPC